MTKLSKKPQMNWVDSKLFIDLLTDMEESDEATIGLDVCDVTWALKAGTQLLHIDRDKVDLLKKISKDVKALLLFFRTNEHTSLKKIIDLTGKIKSYIPEDADVKISSIPDKTITKNGEIKASIWVVI